MKCPKCGGLALRNFDLETFTNDIWGECVECGAIFIEREQAGITVSKGVKKMTNGDKIRGMTDVELARFIQSQAIDRNIGVTYDAWFDWLKLEAEPLKVGDEVKLPFTGAKLVVYLNDSKRVCAINQSNHYEGDGSSLIKTGRHFPQVAELFKAMEGETK